MVYLLLPAISNGKILWGSGPLDVPGKAESAEAQSPASEIGEAREGGATASLVTTCSALVRMYPADAVNYFYKGRHKVAYFYAYILLSPPSETSRQIVNEWRDPSGALFCRKELTVQPQIPRDLVKAGDQSYAYYLFVNHVGLEEAVTATGQTRPASETGLYSVNLKVDGKETARTFFRVRDSLPEKKSAPDRDELRKILPEPFRNRDIE